jgi:hypothetical protein
MAYSGNVPLGTWFDTTTNKDTFKLLVREWYDSTARDALVEWKEVFKDIKTGDEYEREGRLAGLGAMSQISDGQVIPLETAKLYGVKDYTQVRYGLGFRITDRMKRFNKINLMQRLTTDLKKRMLEDKDIEVAKLWNNATNATSTLYGGVGFDTLAFASTAHTLLTDATPTSFSNYGAADLGTASYEAALVYFDAIYDDRGFIFVKRPSKLIVNKSFRVRAFQLTGADKKPFEFSNTKYDLNAYFKMDVSPFVYHRLTSATSWFVICNPSEADFGPRVYTSLEPDLETKDGDDRSRDTQVTSQQYFKYGFTDARLCYVGNI